MTLAWVAKATVVLAVALMAVWLSSRRSAAFRCAVLVAACSALLALPWLEAAIPRRTALPEAVVAAASAVIAAVPSPGLPAAAPTEWSQTLWLLGFAFFLLRTAIGYGLSFIREPKAPMTVGVIRPRIRFPAASRHWSPALRRSVELHEQAHITRRDPLWNLVAQLARAVYWFHPLVWVAVHRLRAERERACDDMVLAAGVRSSGYASHLMLCARSPGALASGLLMAGPSQLETRIEALLSPSTVRERFSLRQRAAIAAGWCALLVPLAAFGSPTFSPRSVPMLKQFLVPVLAVAGVAQSAEVSGRVFDASNATVPRAQVLLKQRQTSNVFTAVTNETGDYRLSSLPDGYYDLEILMPGFARYLRRGIHLAGGSSVTVSAVLQIGEVQESFEVVVSGQPRPPQQNQPPGRQRIRVGGLVQPLKLLHRSPPIYPDAARSEGREGNVMLKAVVGTGGSIVNTQVLPGADPDLATAAEAAVKQWRYEPARLNGQPIETVTTVEVNFRLGGGA